MFALLLFMRAPALADLQPFEALSKPFEAQGKQMQPGFIGALARFLD
jgi:hypothetical protein